jgi:protein TonB
MRKNSAAYIEMLFEKRNKTYGAYDLRVNYENRLIKSFGMALLIGGLFFLIPFLLTKVLTKKHLKNEDPVIITTFPIISPGIITPVTKPKPAQQKLVANDSYKVVENNQVEEQKVIVDPVDPGTSGGESNSDPSTDNKMIAGNLSRDNDSSDAKVYNAAGLDVVPSFPGGEDAMLRFLKKHLQYPLDARESNITGRVYVSFIIDENGKVTEIKVVRGLGYGTDDEVSRVVRIMPDWSPGKYQGKNVKTSLVMPVFFSLK